MFFSVVWDRVRTPLPCTSHQLEGCWAQPEFVCPVWFFFFFLSMRFLPRVTGVLRAGALLAQSQVLSGDATSFGVGSPSPVFSAQRKRSVGPTPPPTDSHPPVSGMICLIVESFPFLRNSGSLVNMGIFTHASTGLFRGCFPSFLPFLFFPAHIRFFEILSAEHFVAFCTPVPGRHPRGRSPPDLYAVNRWQVSDWSMPSIVRGGFDGVRSPTGVNPRLHFLPGSVALEYFQEFSVFPHCQSLFFLFFFFFLTTVS